MEYTAEQIMQMQPEQLKLYAEYLKKIYNIPKTNDLSIKLIDNIDTYENICKQNWIKSISDMPNYITKGKSTLPDFSMEKAGDIIGNYLSINQRLNKLSNPIKIIEPLAGNGVASKIIYEKIKSKIENIIYIASDIQNLKHMKDKKSYNVEFGIDCIDSINKHQENSDVLLLICPPPYTYDPNSNNEPTGFVDYFAIKKWMDLNKKILIYIGEMGFSDGTSGMYDYMLNHSIWKLKYRNVVIEKEDIFGKLVKKEIFIFENKLHFEKN